MAQLNRYESTIIINASLDDSEIETAISKITKYIEDHNGEIVDKDNWGNRRLTYPIKKRFNGYYVHLIFKAKSDVIPLFEKFLVLEDTILRHLTLQLSDELVEYRKQRELEKGKSSEKEEA